MAALSHFTRCAMKENLLVFALAWLAANTPQLIQLLGALVPVGALLVAGYAIHALVRASGGKK